VKEHLATEVLNKYFAGEFDFSKEYEDNELLKFILPRVQEKVESEEFTIEYFYHFYPSNDILCSMVNDILKDKYDAEHINNITGKIKSILDRYIDNTTLSHDYEYSQIKLSVRIYNDDDTSFSYNDVKKIWDDEIIKDIKNIINNYDLESYNGTVCPHVVLGNGYNIIGNIIPRPLPLSIETEENVGKTTINGIKLDFKQSPLGLDEIYISQISDKLEFRLRAHLKISNFEDCPHIIKEYISNILSFFVEVK